MIKKVNLTILLTYLEEVGKSEKNSKLEKDFNVVSKQIPVPDELLGITNESMFKNSKLALKFYNDPEYSGIVRAIAVKELVQKGYEYLRSQSN